MKLKNWTQKALVLVRKCTLRLTCRNGFCSLLSNWFGQKSPIADQPPPGLVPHLRIEEEGRRLLVLSTPNLPFLVV